MSKELTLTAAVENLDAATDFVNTQLEEAGCSMKTEMLIDLALEEMFTNVVNYAYKAQPGSVTIRFILEGQKAVITLIDEGTPYDPLQHEDPDVTLSAQERQIGGLGIFLVRKNMEDLSYEHKDGRNVFTMKKTL